MVTFSFAILRILPQGRIIGTANRPPLGTPEVVATVVDLRQGLLAAGHDAGPQTIAHHLAAHSPHSLPSRSTIWRILRRHGLITPEPHERPRSYFVRSEAASPPNERWQAGQLRLHPDMLNLVLGHDWRDRWVGDHAQRGFGRR